jgi:hypothetical protein
VAETAIWEASSLGQQPNTKEMLLGDQLWSMGERESQIDRDISVDIETSLDGSTDPEQDVDSESEAGAVRSRLGSIATTRSLGTALVLSILGIVAFSFVPFLSVAGTVLGIATGGFAYGLGSEAQRYVEMAIAGAVAGGGAMLLDNLIVALVASGATLLGFSLLAGAAAGLVGHYFGRDLRAGLTADLE